MFSPPYSDRTSIIQVIAKVNWYTHPTSVSTLSQTAAFTSFRYIETTFAPKVNAVSSPRNQRFNHRDSSQDPNMGEVLESPVDGERATNPTDVPELTALLPAIFVPLERDFLQPIAPAKDRIELLQRMQKSLDANEKAVRGNLVWMLEREARRRFNAATKNKSLAEPHEPRTITWAEGEELLASMAAPASPNRTYLLSSAELESTKMMPVDTGLDQLPPHERAAREVLVVVHQGSVDIEGYSKRHIKPIRERLNASLGKEKANDDSGMFVP